MCLEDVLATQAGVVSRSQALATSFTPQEVDRLVARRRWRPVHPRVYLVGESSLTDEARMWAAVLWAGEGAVLAGVAAAWWWGLPVRAPSTVAVTVPRRRAPGRRPGVVLRRRTLPVADLAEHRGLPVTALPLTALEAAMQVGPVFLEAVTRRRVPWEDVARAAGRADTGERLLAEVEERARLRLAGVLRRAGVPAHVAPGRRAVVCPAHRVLVVDSGGTAPPGWKTVVGTDAGEIVARVREAAAGVRVTG